MQSSRTVSALLCRPTLLQGNTSSCSARHQRIESACEILGAFPSLVNILFRTQTNTPLQRNVTSKRITFEVCSYKSRGRHAPYTEAPRLIRSRPSAPLSMPQGCPLSRVGRRHQTRWHSFDDSILELKHCAKQFEKNNVSNILWFVFAPPATTWPPNARPAARSLLPYPRASCSHQRSRR